LPSLVASKLYAGRNIQEASKAAAGINAKLIIVSAGLGLVESKTLIPSYALSVGARTKDNVLTRIEGDATSLDWWEALKSTSCFSIPMSEIADSTTGIIIVALSESYLGMVTNDLKRLAPEDRSRIRILTRASSDRIDPALHPYLMPYDDRLDGPDSPVKGTRADFAARAARHFAANVVASIPEGSMEEHARAVSIKLDRWRAAPVFQRARHEDAVLIQIIQENWERAEGQSGRLLRVLRDDLSIACEQGRFIGLMKRARDERKVAA
jgi:hypothetical protein